MAPTTKQILGHHGHVHRLDISDVFNGLTHREKLYAYHMSRAAWAGARIIMQQVSPESESIFDLILDLHRSCAGNWTALAERIGVSHYDVECFLEYASTFLSNLGNYYGAGDQKFVPRLPAEEMETLAATTYRTADLYAGIQKEMYSIPPHGLGFASEMAQTAYYRGASMSRERVEKVSDVAELHGILPENTRVHKVPLSDSNTYSILQASVDQHTSSLPKQSVEQGFDVQLLTGDHSEHLAKMCEQLRKAITYAANERQEAILAKTIESFETGSLDSYRDALRVWVMDKSPTIESVFGFVEPYRDPFGVRAEFEASVLIKDVRESGRLKTLVDNAAKFIRKLPWAEGATENDRKGPFENATFEAPNLSVVHVLAWCTSHIPTGVNLPNYNDIRQSCGSKNLIITNRIAAARTQETDRSFVLPSEAETYQRHRSSASYIGTILHELLGHGTGKMMGEEAPGQFNFDVHNPPLSALTSAPITSWYLPGQTLTGQFRDLATVLDECRAILVGLYLMDDKELLAMFGHTDDSEITAEDVTYNAYLQVCIQGVRGLQNFHVEDNKWGQAHGRARFAMLKCLLREGDGLVRIVVNATADSLHVEVDRSKIASHGKPALGRMLLRLHMYWCTADVEACRAYYEDLSAVEEEHRNWRQIALRQNGERLRFVQANIFLRDDDAVELQEYDVTITGIVDSWAERDC